MSTPLALADLNAEINHEVRVPDLRLAEALGFADPHMIRRLIERHREALERFGAISVTVTENTGKRGRPGKTYWLSKRQALFLCTKSEAPLATETTIQMVEVFDAWQAGALKPVKVRSYSRAAPKPRPKRPALPSGGHDLQDVVMAAAARAGLGNDFGHALDEALNTWLDAERRKHGVELAFEASIDRHALALDIQKACGRTPLSRPQQDHLEGLHELRQARKHQPHLAFPKHLRDEGREAELYAERLSRLDCAHCLCQAACPAAFDRRRLT